MEIVTHRWFAVAGACLVALGGFFLWRELQLNNQYLLSVVAVVAAAVSIAERRRTDPHIGPSALLATAIVGGVWFGLIKSAALMLGVCVTFFGAMAALLHAQRRAPDDSRRMALSWAAVTGSGLVSSAAVHFQTLTVGVAQESLARRLVLTLAWLVTGLWIVVWQGRRRPAAVSTEGAPRRPTPPLIAGMAFVLAAVVKVVTYDTTHLGGMLRVLGLVVCGALLLLTGALITHSQRKEV